MKRIRVLDPLSQRPKDITSPFGYLHRDGPNIGHKAGPGLERKSRRAAPHCCRHARRAPPAAADGYSHPLLIPPKPLNAYGALLTKFEPACINNPIK
jgi:hypothetical protein